MELETNDGPAFPELGSNFVDRVLYVPPNNGTPGRVFINRTQYFEGVEPDNWGLTIGSYRPAVQWLKDRKGRVLTDNDIDHYRQILSALAGTERLMNEIDELIEHYGGWPEAFQ